jgi:Arc/MetJ family transcription regulator
MLDVMTKHLVDIDDQLLARAQALTGDTIRGTVDAALKKLTNDELLRQHIAWLRDPNNGVDASLLDKIRAPRVPLAEDEGE